MIDLHAHIVPSVDDGAVDEVEALEMARAAVEQGCEAVCATPHLWEGLFGTSVETNASGYRVIQRAVEREGIPLKLFAGAENYLAEGDADLFAEKVVTLGEGGRYVLFDFSMASVPSNVGRAIEALAAKGFTALIAHPERNQDLQLDSTPVEDWIAKGARIQVNGPSVLGRHGREAHETALVLLEAGAVHVLASDAHGMRRRFCLGEVFEAVAEHSGRDLAERLCKENPWRVIRGKDLEAGPVKLERQSRAARFLRRFRG